MEPSTTQPQTTAQAQSAPLPGSPHKNLYVIAGSSLGAVLVVGAFVGMYMWQQSTYTAKIDAITAEKATVEQEIVSLKGELNKEKERSIREIDFSTSTKVSSLLDTSVIIEAPKEYSFVKSEEKNRRGSFVSYEVVQPKDLKTPYLSEIQFFSKDSIEVFVKKCGEENCFSGDYPNSASYIEQKISFMEGRDYQKSLLKKFNDRNWFVTTLPCSGDSCSIREYTTFLGDTKNDVWIMMSSSTEEQEADALFSQLRFR